MGHRRSRRENPANRLVGEGMASEGSGSVWRACRENECGSRGKTVNPPAGRVAYPSYPRPPSPGRTHVGPLHPGSRRRRRGGRAPDGVSAGGAAAHHRRLVRDAPDRVLGGELRVAQGRTRGPRHPGRYRRRRRRREQATGAGERVPDPRVDGVIIAPKDGATVLPVIKAANAAGVPIVLSTGRRRNSAAGP